MNHFGLGTGLSNYKRTQERKCRRCAPIESPKGPILCQSKAESFRSSLILLRWTMAAALSCSTEYFQISVCSDNGARMCRCFRFSNVRPEASGSTLSWRASCAYVSITQNGSPVDSNINFISLQCYPLPHCGAAFTLFQRVYTKHTGLSQFRRDNNAPKTTDPDPHWRMWSPSQSGHTTPA